MQMTMQAQPRRVLDTINNKLSQASPTLSSFATLIFSSSKSNNSHATLKLFSQMKHYKLTPDAYLLPSGIKACASLSAINLGRQMHCFALTSGSALDCFVQSSLVHMYIKCSQLVEAHKVFDEMNEKDVVCFSALSAGYARKGDVRNARKVFDEMVMVGIMPNQVSWNGLIAGFNQSGKFSQAVSVFLEMKGRSFVADGTSLSSALAAVGDLRDSKMGVQIHGHVIKMGFLSDKYVVSAIIDMYGKCGWFREMLKVFEEVDQIDVGGCNALVSGLSRNGLVDEALSVFTRFRDQGVDLNVVTWTSIIACCSQHGRDMESLELFREMQLAGVEPNSVTIPCLLPACGNIAALAHGKAAHCFSLRRGFSDDVYVGSALIDLYANCGKIKKARLFFDTMSKRNLVCWNAMLGAYAMHGKAKKSFEIFLMMQRYGVKPDSVSFTSLLSACSQSGLTEEGRFYFNSMSRDHGIEPRREHYACMVSLLGRAGKLEEAYSMIKSMPLEPDGCVWGALLSSCRVHHSMSLGEVAAHRLFELEPQNPGNYILLSNIYASRGKWKEVDKVRDMMKRMGLRKNPGCSWIECKNKVHMLLAGDKSHPQMARILEKLGSLTREMKISGYSPNTDFVLQDVEEQEKEQILCGHSEKLAVVLGILNTDAGSPLSVIKNLRICGDCHDFMKYISGFEGREICVRDTNRFHHFKDGVCSCGDYW